MTVIDWTGIDRSRLADHLKWSGWNQAVVDKFRGGRVTEHDIAAACLYRPDMLVALSRSIRLYGDATESREADDLSQRIRLRWGDRTEGSSDG